MRAFPTLVRWFLVAPIAAAVIRGMPASALDPGAAERAAAILSRMNLDEKVGQLNLISNGPGYRPEMVPAGSAGALINFNNARDVAAAQAAARASRLGIPLLFGLDVLHGFRTMFPLPIGEAATFDPDLARLAATWSAREAAYVGVNWTYAPMADLSRDPRWGRMVEGFGEDPWLGRAFTTARVEGLRAGGLATSVKHFAGYSAGAGGRDYDETEIPPALLHDIYLPPFKAAVDAGTESVMSAFNALNGVPSTANPALLTDLLRSRWKFDGFVVSDWSAISELIAHGIAGDAAEAGRIALLAGVDMDMMSGVYDATLAAEVRSGRVPEGLVDRAVLRVLRTKLRMGLFERADIDPTRVDSVFPTPESRAASRLVARETIVLLRNPKGALPIVAGRSVAVIGGLAASAVDLLGPHGARAHAQDNENLVDALSRRAAQAGAPLTFASGCAPLCPDEAGFEAALATARAADLVVAVLGEPAAMSGEAASRAYLTLPGRQAELLERLVATGRPVVVVLLAGRPLELGPIAEKLAGLVMAWYPGTEGGAALADILWGDVNPSGKLPITWPRTVGQVPLVYNRLPTGRPSLAENRFTLRYLDESVEPLHPFGFGLSYTRFGFSNLALPIRLLGQADTVLVEADVTNTGSRAGKVAVQVYFRDLVASRSRPLRELKAFSKIALDPGETRRVALNVPVAELGFHREDGSYVVEPGRFQVWVGEDSQAALTGMIEVGVAR